MDQIDLPDGVVMRWIPRDPRGGYRARISPVTSTRTG